MERGFGRVDARVRAVRAAISRNPPVFTDYPPRVAAGAGQLRGKKATARAANQREPRRCFSTLGYANRLCNATITLSFGARARKPARRATTDEGR